MASQTSYELVVQFLFISCEARSPTILNYYNLRVVLQEFHASHAMTNALSAVDTSKLTIHENKVDKANLLLHY